MPALQRHGDVFVLHLGDGENRINLDSASEFAALLDEVDAAEGPKALVTTATGKFFSNGLDAEWAGNDHGRLTELADALEPILGRILTMALPTVAAIGGHAYAAGALLALAHDYRVMRADRGFFCLPEIDLHLAFPRGMADLVVAKLSPAAARDAMITGRRYGGTDALAAGIVEEAVPGDEVLPRALALAGGLAAKADGSMGTIKRRMYHQAAKGLLPEA